MRFSWMLAVKTIQISFLPAQYPPNCGGTECEYFGIGEEQSFHPFHRSRFKMSRFYVKYLVNVCQSKSEQVVLRINEN